MAMQAVLPRPPEHLSNPYQPLMARIVRIHRMVQDNYLFQLRFVDDAVADHVRPWEVDLPFLRGLKKKSGARLPARRPVWLAG